MASDVKKLPDGELEVMQVVWDLEPPVERAQIEAKLRESRPIASTTVLTMLSRLAERVFLKIEKAGRGNAYVPLVTRKDYLASQSRRFIDKLCGGSMAAFAAALCDSGLSREDIDELRALLERDEL